MAKKTIWKDNNTPPTNYIWMRTDASGNVIGVYEYINGSWTKVGSQRAISESSGTVVSKNGGEVSYYATMEQGAEGMDLSGIIYRDENGIAQVATLNEDSSTWRAEDIVNVNTMKTYVEDVTEDIADDILESEEFNTKVVDAVNNLDIEVSADPLWVNIN